MLEMLSIARAQIKEGNTSQNLLPTTKYTKTKSDLLT